MRIRILSKDEVSVETWVLDALMDFIDASTEEVGFLEGLVLLPWQAEAYREACRAITGHACTCKLPVQDGDKVDS
jgi:hypothetical protein